MRVTAKIVNAVVQQATTATDGRITATHGAGYHGIGDRWTLTLTGKAAKQYVWLSAQGENRAAAAFFTGVLAVYADELTGTALAAHTALSGNDVFDEWFSKGQSVALSAKRAEGIEKERAEHEAIAADKATMRDESLPIEERRAAFRRHNRRGNPFYEGQTGTVTAEPTPRRVESSSQDLTDETGYNGTNWPTHTVDVWLQNDGKVIEDATNHARVSADSLSDYVGKLLFDVHGLPSIARERLTQTDAHTFANVREGLVRDIDGTGTAQEAFKRIDWEYVRASLLDLN
ncbi:hypothetical protein ACWD7M_16230 [Streptomyces griseus]